MNEPITRGTESRFLGWMGHPRFTAWHAVGLVIGIVLAKVIP